MRSPSVIVAWSLACLCVGFCAAHADSLYRPGAYHSLVSDQRASHVGESLTVLIYEQATAQTNADTSTKSDVGVSAEATLTDTRDQAGLQLANNFKGGGAISRSGKLIASVSVTVEQVLPTGELWVKGDQLIELNDDKQEITLTGRVRPQDISADNTVPSTRLADAHISYVGEGVLAEGQRPGILTRFFNWLF